MSKEKKSDGRLSLNTMQMIALGFLGVILLGGVLLWLPFSNQEPIAFADALFTSVSAVCVTGLLTIVPATQFTVAGKVILLVLIQIGGLGVIACTVAFFLILRKKITMKERVIIQQTYGLDTLSGLVKYMLLILKGTFLVEGIGACCYAFRFVPEFGVVKGLAYSIFQSISAFCNAGIDILGDQSYKGYATSPIVNFTTMALIVLSGLGFLVWHDIGKNIIHVWKQKLPKKRMLTRLGVQSKIVLVMTGFLIFFGMIGFFLLEYHNPETMGTMSVGEKLMASAFQSVTSRTAGFAAVSQGDLTPASKLLGCILMFIGGSPGGTAGGVKTTTVALLLLVCISVLRGSKDAECFGRKIASSVVRSAVTIILVTFLIWVGGIAVITILEPNVDFLDIMYEATSAIATVGLSADLTPLLGRGSQAVLMFLMYAGRIGPVTMALVFAGKARKSSQLRELPEKHIMIG